MPNPEFQQKMADIAEQQVAADAKTPSQKVEEYDVIKKTAEELWFAFIDWGWSPLDIEYSLYTSPESAATIIPSMSIEADGHGKFGVNVRLKAGNRALNLPCVFQKTGSQMQLWLGDSHTMFDPTPEGIKLAAETQLPTMIESEWRKAFCR